MTPLNLPFILHGGDYNPDQWPPEIRDADMRLMRDAHWNIATLPVFGWSALEPAEGRYTFDWLDQILDKLHSNGMRVCLATPTASMPPWMSQKYPHVRRANENRIRVDHGGRQANCPNSPDFRRLADNITRQMAQRYAKHPALLLWHVSNEYYNRCFCDLCASSFRGWLQNRYNTLDQLNDRWYTSFWGNHITDWNQIDPPSAIGQGCLQALKIDYDRFQNESYLNSYLAERMILKELTPGVPVTTNMMGAFKAINYHAWADHLDVVAHDSYPRHDWTPDEIVFTHAVMRGLKQGQPWLLMEQTPSQQNWARYNFLKRPGVMRLWSYLALAHGSDSVMYFQWRRSRGGIEKFHGAVVEHEGSSKPRVFQEVAQLGKELESLGTRTLNTRVVAHAAVLFDWESWWALEYSAGPSVDLEYKPLVQRWFAALHNNGITADVLHPLADLSKYKLVIAPLLYMVTPQLADHLEQYVSNGGTLVLTAMSGIVDDTDRVHLGGYPGPLRQLAGVWVEEIDALPPDQSNRVVFENDLKNLPGACHILFERIHAESAAVLGRYEQDFYAGEPAVTLNRFGKGNVYYIGTIFDKPAATQLVAEICKSLNISSVLPQHVAGVETIRRIHPDGQCILYILNHNAEQTTVTLPQGDFQDLLTRAKFSHSTQLPRYAVLILTKS